MAHTQATIQEIDGEQSDDECNCEELPDDFDCFNCFEVGDSEDR